MFPGGNDASLGRCGWNSFQAFRMNLRNALTVIRVLCETNDRCSDDVRESILGGIFDLADTCIQSIQEFEVRHRKKAESELELIKDAAEEGLQLRDFPDAFRKIEFAASKAIAANPQTEDP